MGKLRVFESFSGVGCQSLALRNIGIDYEVVGISEVDKHALLCYDAIHNDPISIDIPDKQSILDEIHRCNIAYNFSSGKSEIPKNEKDLQALYVAHKRSKNFGDIRKILPLLQKRGRAAAVNQMQCVQSAGACNVQQTSVHLAPVRFRIGIKNDHTVKLESFRKIDRHEHDAGQVILPVLQDQLRVQSVGRISRRGAYTGLRNHRDALAAFLMHLSDQKRKLLQKRILRVISRDAHLSSVPVKTLQAVMILYES